MTCYFKIFTVTNLLHAVKVHLHMLLRELTPGMYVEMYDI